MRQVHRDVFSRLQDSCARFHAGGGFDSVQLGIWCVPHVDYTTAGGGTRRLCATLPLFTPLHNLTAPESATEVSVCARRLREILLRLLRLHGHPLH